MMLGKLFAEYTNDTSSAQSEGAGWSIRFGRRHFVVGHINYRTPKNCWWPRWAMFSLVFWRPE